MEDKEPRVMEGLEERAVSLWNQIDAKLLNKNKIMGEWDGIYRRREESLNVLLQDHEKISHSNWLVNTAWKKATI